MCVRKLCFLVLAAQCVLSQDLQEREKFSIGALFYEDEALDLKAALEIGASMYDFTTNVKEIPSRGDIRQVTQKVCELAKEKVIGIIDGTGGVTSEHVQVLTDMLELPQVMVKYNDLSTANWSYINLHPSASAYNKVLKDLIVKKDWNNFTILYVKGHSIDRVSELFSSTSSKEDRYTISVRELSGDDYRDVLTNAKEHGYYNFVVDCPSENIEQVLTHAQQVGLMADEHSYIFVSPDLFTLDLNRFRFGGVNMTGLRLLGLENKDNTPLWTFTEQFNNQTGKELNPEDFKTQVLLVYDAVAVFNEGVRKIKNLMPEELSCEDFQAWAHGSSLLNFMKTNKVDGLTRSLTFDGLGERVDVSFDVLELTPSGNQTIGYFKNYTLDILDRPFLPVNDIGGGSQMRNKTFRILIATTPPYGYIKASEEELIGNDRYEGFTIDLIEEVAKLLGFHYEFEVENDYGKRDSHGKWDGMVLKLMEEKADFAICDFTMTAERQQAIDFSTPFMTLGISIMYKQPSKQPPAMFSFMNVFSTEVWLFMMFVQMGIGVILIFVGRISHKEWQNPVPCIEQPEELSNQFSFANSLWLIIGSVMQQGSEIAPIALAPRLITSVWWFFTMVMVASYVGTLVAFLTVENDVWPFHNAEELFKKKGAIAFGAKSPGTTIQMFEKSSNKHYKEMYEMMKKNNWLVKSNDQGVEKCETMDYAFFCESTSIEYYQARHCDLLQVGGLLDSKSYGIGIKKGSSYKRDIDDALLNLKEKGIIQKLKDLWWKEKKGGGQCGEKVSDEIKQLGMKNMIGAFVVLGAGCLIGIVISFLDMLWAVFKRSVKYKTTFKYELVEELKFAIKFSGDIKPVKRPSSSGSSSEALAEVMDPEARDELGSLRSAPTVRSGKSTSTSKSTHSHRSRHSSRSLSVAFARRRQYT